jgi:hypothetical protein
MGRRRVAVAVILLAFGGCGDEPEPAGEPDALAVARVEWAAIDVRMSAHYADPALDLPDEELERQQAEVEALYRPEREAVRARLAALGLSLD